MVTTSSEQLVLLPWVPLSLLKGKCPTAKMKLTLASGNGLLMLVLFLEKWMEKDIGLWEIPV